MYQADIERHEHEKEHTHIALNHMTVSLMNLQSFAQTLIKPVSRQSSKLPYKEVTRGLREIVSNLRPAMLMYGIIPAINKLADNLMEHNGDKIMIKVDIRAGEERLRQTSNNIYSESRRKPAKTHCIMPRQNHYPVWHTYFS